MAKKNLAVQERRNFIRLRQVLPVDFWAAGEGKDSPIGSFSGFTYDISKAGLRLRANVLPGDFWQSVIPRKTLIQGIIHIPFSSRKIKFSGEVAWKKQGGESFSLYELGVMFKDILPKDENFLLKFARFNHFYPKAVIAAVCLLLGVLGWSLYSNARVVLRNRRLVKKMAVLLEDISLKESFISQSKNIIAFLENRMFSINKRLKDSLKRMEELKQEYEAAQAKLKAAEGNNKVLADMDALKDKMAQLNSRIEALRKENSFLKKNLILEQQALKQKTTEILADYDTKRALESKNIVLMYKWIKSHQNQHTGLIMSYEGDDELQDWAFTNDQALAVFVFLLFDDYGPARKILDFYLNKALDYKGGFINSYYASSGGPCEYIAHSGPNTWIGLAALGYFEKTKDKKYLNIALRVYKFLKKMQDKEGGVIGGPAVKWYSTEHNLDAYAFFRRMYSVFKNKIYQHDAEKALAWIDKYAYTSKNIPVNRGRGDSTIATDTYAWSIASIGP